MTHTTPVFYCAVITFQDPAGLTCEHIAGPKIQNAGQILKFMCKIVYVHTQVPIALWSAVGLQVVTDCTCKFFPFIPCTAYDGYIHAKLTLPYVHFGVGVSVSINTYSACFNIECTRHIHIQALFIGLALLAFGVFPVQVFHEPGDGVVVTDRLQNLRASRQSCCRLCSPNPCHSLPHLVSIQQNRQY